MREKNVHVCFDVGALFSYVSAAAIKHHDQGNLQFVWDNDSRGIKVFHGRDTAARSRHGRWNRELRTCILHCKHEAEGVNWKWFESLNAQSPPLVMDFIQ